MCELRLPVALPGIIWWGVFLRLCFGGLREGFKVLILL